MAISACRDGRRMRADWWRTAACACTLVCLAATASEAAWHRLDNPNFVIVGGASAREMRDIAVKFEAFREILGQLRGRDVAIAPVPTVIVVFRSAKAFAPYAPRFEGRPRDLAGLFISRRDVNHIALVNDEPAYAASLMYHEYAHLLVSNMSGAMPLWLHEGLAEFYGTFEARRAGGRQALVGLLVGPLMTPLYEPQVRDAARKLMGWLVTLEKQRQSATARPEPQQAAPPDTRPTATDPGVQRLQPVFRKTKEDEQRVEGLLQRIDCSIRGAVVFVLQTADQTIRLSARRMKDVEFITYREDLAGDVKCGAMKEPMRVYVTSREPSTPKGTRAVVAIEFLPKE